MSEAPRHFVAYHKVDERGPLRGDGDGGGRFETNKPSKPRKGDVLWCIEGEGSPKKYSLAARGVVTRLTTDTDGTSILHYKAPGGYGRTDVTGLPWFRKLFRDQGFFGFGLNLIKHPESVSELESLAAGEAITYTDLCAYTLKHSSTFEGFAGDGEHTIDTKGRSWARIAGLHADRKDGETVPIIFAPAERFVRVT